MAAIEHVTQTAELPADLGGKATTAELPTRFAAPLGAR